MCRPRSEHVYLRVLRYSDDQHNTGGARETCIRARQEKLKI